MRSRLVVIVLVAVVSLAGCSGTDAVPPPPTSAPPPPTAPPVELRLGHIDGSADFDPAVAWFAEAVEQESGGTVTVDTQFSCCGDGQDAERTLVGKVAAGDLDLGWVGVRAFAGDEMHVPGAAALVAPFVVGGYAQERAVLQDRDVARVLDGFEGIGVVGLALVPGGQRFALGADGQAAEPADFVDRTVHVLDSAVAVRTMRALGATASEVGFEERDAGLADGSIQGVENTLTFFDGHTDLAPYVTLDALWPRVSVLVATPSRWGRLSAEQQDAVRSAARATVLRTTELRDVDQRALVHACLGVGHAAAPTDAQAAAMRAAVEPVVDELRADPAEAAILDAAAAAVASVPADHPLELPRRRLRLTADSVAYWDRQASRYDAATAFLERRVLARAREWLAQRVVGSTLDVAAGTGANLPYLAPRATSVTMVDQSPAMLDLLRRRAAGHDADVRRADAADLPFDDAAFDTVVCTFALCCVPDETRVLRELARVVRPGGRVLLADHVESSAWGWRLVQRGLDLTGRRHGEHYRRRPALRLRAAGLVAVETAASRRRLVESVVAMRERRS